MCEESDCLKATWDEAERRYAEALKALGFAGRWTEFGNIEEAMKLIGLIDALELAREEWMRHRRNCAECRREGQAAG